MSTTSRRRAMRVVSASVIAGGLVAASLGAADATASGSATPVRTIHAGTTVPFVTLADDGTIYAADNDIEVWAPDSSGVPDITKTFTGTEVSGFPSLLEGVGLAYLDAVTSPAVVDVLDPAQAGGPGVPIRSISGNNTAITDPVAVAWTPTGSLWVENSDDDGYQLLRFAPGATGNVAPVQVIAGPKTGLSSGSLGFSTLAGLPDNGVAASPAGVDPSVSVFSSTQSGNVAPHRFLQVPTPGPNWMSEGVAADSKGNIYIGSGDLNGNSFGRLYVFGPTGSTPKLTLGGASQRFQTPLAPMVAHNGELALADLSDFSITSGSIYGNIEVFKPLLATPGKVGSLAVKKSSSTETVSWKAPSSAGGTRISSYKVVVKKGSKTEQSKTVAGTSLAMKRKSLPKGSLKVTVSAVNGGGAGTAASRSFTN
jgi:hypothetical protein